jgi:hypothetical protein
VTERASAVSKSEKFLKRPAPDAVSPIRMEIAFQVDDMTLAWARPLVSSRLWVLIAVSETRLIPSDRTPAVLPPAMDSLSDTERRT